MKITKITQQKKDPQRVSVFIDGKFAFGITYEDAAAYGITENADITPAELDTIKTTLVARRAKSIALKYLSRRMRSEKEVRCKLHSYEEFDEETIDAVIEPLKQYGVIDDSRYAELFCISRAASLDGPQKLRQKLREKGIDYNPAQHQAAIKGDNTPTEAENAFMLLKRRLRGKSDEAPALTFEQKRKLTQYLRSKGYSISAINGAFKQYSISSDDIFTEWDDLND